MKSVWIAAACTLSMACRGESTAPAEPSSGPTAAEVAALEPESASAPTEGGPSAMPEAKAPTDWKRAFAHDVRYDSERTAVVVDVSVDDGFHVYTEGETIGKPMKLTLDPEGDFEIDGAVIYPEGVTKDLPIGRSVIVEGEAEVVAPIRRPSSGGGRAKGSFRYQVCTDEACDRPRTVSFEVEVPAAS